LGTGRLNTAVRGSLDLIRENKRIFLMNQTVI
jgi:hypothetical protein